MHQECSWWPDESKNIIAPTPHLRFLFMDLHCSIWVAELISFILQKARTSTDCEKLQCAHGVLASWHTSPPLLHLSILFCTLQQQAIIKTTKTATWGLQTLQWQRNRPVRLSNIIILVASTSLYHCTILLFFTPHCVFGFCLSKISCCIYC